MCKCFSECPLLVALTLVLCSIKNGLHHPLGTYMSHPPAHLVQHFSVLITAKFLGFTSELEQVLLKEAFRLRASLKVPFTGSKE